MANADYVNDFSSEESDWEDDFTLATIKILENYEKSKNVPEIDESSNSSSSDSEDAEENIPLSDLQTTLTPAGRRWVPISSSIEKTPQIPVFDNDNRGISQDIDQTKVLTVLDYFRLFFTLDFVGQIMEATNNYAQRERTLHPDKHKSKWEPVTTNCMVKFLGLTMFMGIVRKSRIKDYWSKMFEIATPFFNKAMKRDRFMQILRYINFPESNPDSDEPSTDDSAGTPGEAPARRSQATKRMTWLFDTFNSLAKSLYKPRRELAVDESMVAHKGRTTHRQYMPAKPTKWGLKLWVLAESVTGYVLQVFPFFSREDRTPFRIYQDVVLRLLTSADVLGKNHHIYFDNYYTSVPMFEELAAKFKTFCCGTLRLNRTELPKKLMVKTHPKLAERGQCIFSKSADLLLVVWRDRKIIHLLTTIHGSLMSSCERTVKDASGLFVRKEIDCPASVRAYSRYMGGVDLADQLYQYYCFGRKSRKWTKKLFWFVLEIMKLNAYTMYNSTQEKSNTVYDFTLAVLRPLIEEAEINESIPASVQSTSRKIDRLTRRCFPVDMGRKAYCKVCYSRAKLNDNETRRQTKYGCEYCNVHLCIVNCFKIYHTVSNYGKYSGPTVAVAEE